MLIKVEVLMSSSLEKAVHETVGNNRAAETSKIRQLGSPIRGKSLRAVDMVSFCLEKGLGSKSRYSVAAYNNFGSELILFRLLLDSELPSATASLVLTYCLSCIDEALQISSCFWYSEGDMRSFYKELLSNELNNRRFSSERSDNHRQHSKDLS